MNGKGQAKPVFFCCGCAVVLAVAVGVGVYVFVHHLPEILLAYVGGELQDEPLDIPVRTVSEDEVAGIQSKRSAHLEAAAEGEGEDLVISPEEFELMVAMNFTEEGTPEKIENFHLTAEDDKLRVQLSFEVKEGEYVNVDFTGGVRVADGKVSLDLDRCVVGGKEIESEKLEKTAKALKEGFARDPKAAEFFSSFEELETSGGKLRIRLKPEAAGQLLKQEEEPEPEPEPEPAGADV